MTEIPDDIMEMAERALYAVHADEDPAFGSRVIASVIARAVLAERERCAKIAEMHDIRGDIAAAIRKEPAE